MVKEIMQSTDALTFRDPRDCSRGTMESYSSLNEAVTRADKLLFVVLPWCIRDAKNCIGRSTLCIAVHRFTHDIQGRHDEVSN